MFLFPRTLSFTINSRAIGHLPCYEMTTTWDWPQCDEFKQTLCPGWSPAQYASCLRSPSRRQTGSRASSLRQAFRWWQPCLTSDCNLRRHPAPELPRQPASGFPGILNDYWCFKPLRFGWFVMRPQIDDAPTDGSHASSPAATVWATGRLR